MMNKPRMLLVAIGILTVAGAAMATKARSNTYWYTTKFNGPYFPSATEVLCNGTGPQCVLPTEPGGTPVPVFTQVSPGVYQPALTIL